MSSPEELFLLPVDKISRPEGRYFYGCTAILMTAIGFPDSLIRFLFFMPTYDGSISCYGSLSSVRPFSTGEGGAGLG